MKVAKTTFEDEQRQKEEAWLKMIPQQRLVIAFRISEMMQAWN